MDKTNLELYKETGEPRYRELLIKEYAGLVKLLAAQLYAKTASYLLEQSDYESFGILGLLDAIENTTRLWMLNLKLMHLIGSKGLLLIT